MLFIRKLRKFLIAISSIVIFFILIDYINLLINDDNIKGKNLIIANGIKVDIKAKKFLNIQSFKQEGLANESYNKAFGYYIVDIHEYANLSLESNSSSYLPIFDIRNKKEVKDFSKEMNYIIEGSSKKIFNGWQFYLNHVKYNNIDLVIERFADFMIKSMMIKIKENDYNEFLYIAKSLFCFMDHFQYDYPNFIYSAIENKRKLFNILANYYCNAGLKNECTCASSFSESYFFFDNYMQSESNEIMQKSYFDNIFYYSGKKYKAIVILYYMITFHSNIDRLQIPAHNKNVRSIQYNAMLSLGILKNSFWLPITSYKSKAALKLLELNNDDITSSMAKQANKITLISIFNHLNTYYFSPKINPNTAEIERIKIRSLTNGK